MMSSGSAAYGCIICGSADAATVFSVTRSPMHAVRPSGVVGSADGFGHLDIAACGRCGHLSNKT